MKEEKDEILMGFEEKVQDIIYKTKMRMFEIEEKRIQEQKISFIDKVIGKEDLKNARLNNLYAKRQLEIMQYDSLSGDERDINDIISDLYAYSYISLNNQFTDEMSDVYNEICNDRIFKKLINSNRINELTLRKINDSVNISLCLEDNIKGIGEIGKKITKLELDTEKINRKTKTLEIKKSDNIFKIFEV